MPEITTGAGLLALTALLAYLLGAIPFGIVMARAFGLGDLRQIGSGNIGATNVLRTGNRPAAALTLVLDAAKGGVAVLIARASLGEDAAQLAGLAAFLGHLYPVWLGFRGGKGVATFLGTFLAVSPTVGALLCITWLAVALVTRYSSAAALGAAGLSPMLALWDQRGHTLLLAFVMMIFVYIRHRGNLARLRAGKETRIGQKSAPDEA
jgi:glycerol-3-phosphate acyltransferase PlsY